MEKFEQLFRLSYNFIPIIGLVFLVEFQVLRYFFQGKRVIMGLSLIMAAKFILGNYGWNIVVYSLYPTFFEQWSAYVNLAISLLMIFSMGVLPDAGWTEVSSGGLIAEGLVAIFIYIPVYILNTLLGSRVFQDLFAPFTPYYIIVYACALISSVILIYLRPKLLDGLRRRDMKNSKFWRAITIMYSTFCVFISVYSSAMSRRDFDLSFLAFVIIAPVLMMIVYWMIQRGKRKEVEIENRHLQAQRMLMEAYDISRKNQVELARKFRHDIAKHLQGIELLIEAKNWEQEQLLEYREELQQRYEELSLIDYCQDTMVNAVLYYEINRCKELGIEAEIRLQEFQSGHVQSSDLFCLMKELMEQAIAEVHQLVAEKELRIYLSSAVKAGCLILCVRHSAVGQVTQSERKSWWKRNPKDEIKRIAEKYNGDIYVEQRERERETVVRLSLE